MNIRDLFSRIYYRSIGRFIECATLYKLDLSNYEKREPIEIPDSYIFHIATEADITLLKSHYQETPGKMDVVTWRFQQGNYICFSYLDTDKNEIAYTRWCCMDEFYSAALRQTVKLSQDQILTLDSFTDSGHRRLGLHHAMNIIMLNWLKDSGVVQEVYMVILCFIPHLSKIPRSLGYRPVKTRIHLKKRTRTLPR